MIAGLYSGIQPDRSGYAMRKLLINIICSLIPVRRKRKALRARLIERWKTRHERMIEETSHRVELVLAAMADSYHGLLKLKMYQARIEPKYHYVFQEMVEGDLCIDCGVNMGVVTDVLLHQRGEVYGFEPHGMLFPKLVDKYRDCSGLTLQQAAVWDRNGQAVFKRSRSDSTDWTNTEGASMFVQVADEVSCTVQVIDLTEFIDGLLRAKGRSIHLLKLDVEGAEFEILEALIAKEQYRSIKHILCETHARLFADGAQRLERLEALIRAKGIDNIHLDWV